MDVISQMQVEEAKLRRMIQAAFQAQLTCLAQLGSIPTRVAFRAAMTVLVAPLVIAAAPPITKVTAAVDVAFWLLREDLRDPPTYFDGVLLDEIRCIIFEGGNQ